MKNVYKNKSDDELFDLLKYNPKLKSDIFNEIYERYSPQIYTYCVKILNDDELANDVFQETFIKFFEGLSDMDNMDNILGYLIVIARNSCLNEKKVKSHSHIPLEEFMLPAFEQNYENKELSDLLEIGLEAMPDNYKEMIVLKEFMGLSYKEISTTLNISIDKVRVRIFRAKKKLREVLAPYIKDLNEK